MACSTAAADRSWLAAPCIFFKVDSSDSSRIVETILGAGDGATGAPALSASDASTAFSLVAAGVSALANACTLARRTASFSFNAAAGETASVVESPIFSCAALLIFWAKPLDSTNVNDNPKTSKTAAVLPLHELRRVLAMALSSIEIMKIKNDSLCVAPFRKPMLQALSHRLCK